MTQPTWIELATATANVVLWLEIESRGPDAIPAVSILDPALGPDGACSPVDRYELMQGECIGLSFRVRDPFWHTVAGLLSPPPRELVKERTAHLRAIKVEAGEGGMPASEERDSDAAQANVTEGSHSPELRALTKSASETEKD